jgi:hypothetical protein
MSPAARGLHRVSASDLTRLTRAIARADFADPVTRAALVLAKFGHLEGELDALVGQPKNAAVAIIAAVLRERSNTPARAVTGVWNGPPPTGQGTRAAFDSLLELIASAQRSVVFTGAELERDARLLRSLHAAQRGRELQATVVLAAAPSGDASTQLRELFQAREPLPRLYRPDPARLPFPIPQTLLVDGERAVLLAGAPASVEPEDCALTLGVLVEDAPTVVVLEAQWHVLIEQAALLPL